MTDREHRPFARQSQPASEPPICRFELLSTLPQGGDTSAVRLRWDAGEQDWAWTDHTMLVSDPLTRWSGVTGDRGWAQWRPDAKRWEVIAMNTPTLMRGLVNNPEVGLTAELASVLVDNLQPLDGTVAAITGPADNVTGHNVFAMERDHAAGVLLARNYALGRWEIVGPGAGEGGGEEITLHGYLYYDLTHDMSEVVVEVTQWQGGFPGDQNSHVTCLNPVDRLRSGAEETKYVFEGNTDSWAKATLYIDPVLGVVIRLDAVQCPIEKPFGPEPGGESLSPDPDMAPVASGWAGGFA